MNFSRNWHAQHMVTNPPEKVEGMDINEHIPNDGSFHQVHLVRWDNPNGHILTLWVDHKLKAEIHSFNTKNFKISTP